MKTVLLALGILSTLNVFAADVPNCWIYTPSENGKYSLTLPKEQVAEVTKFLNSRNIFVITESRYSRSLQAHTIALETRNDKMGPLLLEKSAVFSLSKLPSEVSVSCDPNLDVTANN